VHLKRRRTGGEQARGAHDQLSISFEGTGKHERRIQTPARWILISGRWAIRIKA